MEWRNPLTFSSHSTTPITTTAFRILLIVPAIGIKLFTSHSRTPTTIRVIKICMRGIVFASFCQCGETLPSRFPGPLHTAESSCRSMFLALVNAEGFKLRGWTAQQNILFTAA
jgi:hypothetical protein